MWSFEGPVQVLRVKADAKFARGFSELSPCCLSNQLGLSLSPALPFALARQFSSAILASKQPPLCEAGAELVSPSRQFPCGTHQANILILYMWRNLRLLWEVLNFEVALACQSSEFLLARYWPIYNGLHA